MSNYVRKGEPRKPNKFDPAPMDPVLLAELTAPPAELLPPIPEPKVTKTRSLTVSRSVPDDSAEDLSTQVKDYAASHAVEGIDLLMAIARDDKAKDNHRIDAIKEVLIRGIGRPAEHIETTSTSVSVGESHLDAVRRAAQQKLFGPE